MIDVVKKGIYTKLNTTSAVTSLLSSATAIYHNLAPAGAALPYVIFVFAGGGDDNDTQVDSADLMYYIKGVAETASTAEQIAAAIRTALHGQTLTLDAPWVAYRCQHKMPIVQTEKIDHKQYFHFGGSYRIRITQ